LNFFNASWVADQTAPHKEFWSKTVASAVEAFEQSKRQSSI
jgi:hypothetical protein